jgi:hypothetical protein
MKPCKHHWLDYGRGRAKCQFCGRLYEIEKSRQIMKDIRILIDKLKTIEKPAV